MKENAQPAPLRLAAYATDLYHCADCNYCVDAVWEERGIDHVCPTQQHHLPLASYSGRGYIAAARAWFEGADLNLDSLAERVFTCTGCGNCEQICPIGLRPTQIGQALREELVALGHAPEAVRDLRASMQRAGNPFGRARAHRNAWAAQCEFVAEEATVLYAPGCAAAHESPAEARAILQLLQMAGERVAHRGENDRCCGAPLLEVGLNDDATDAEARLAVGLSAPLVVCAGLECWPVWARALNGADRVLSFPAWLLRAMASGALAITPLTDGPRQVSAFDACAARRRGAQTGTPNPLREILRAIGLDCGNDLPAGHAVCCGAAGGMPAQQPESAARMASARVSNATETIPMVVSDPRCLAHLRRSAAGSTTIYGLAEFILLHCDARGVVP